MRNDQLQFEINMEKPISDNWIHIWLMLNSNRINPLQVMKPIPSSHLYHNVFCYRIQSVTHSHIHTQINECVILLVKVRNKFYVYDGVHVFSTKIYETRNMMSSSNLRQFMVLKRKFVPLKSLNAVRKS